MKYKLENDQLTVETSTLGGELTSIKDSAGTEYLWQADPAYWKGQAPVLFPIVGSLRDKKAVIGGNKTCCMERHGVVRKLEFEKKESSFDSITFSVCSNEETKKRYPYDFELMITYILRGKDVVTKYTVVNQSNETLPFQIGGHPAFNCPLGADESFENYVVEFKQKETADCPALSPTGLVEVASRTRMLDNSNFLKLNHELFKTDALIFDQLKSRKATLCNPLTGKGIQIQFSDFNNLLVWSSTNGGPFIALEPWSGLPTCSDEGDIFEQKRGVYLLAPGESKSLSFTITVI